MKQEDERTKLGRYSEALYTYYKNNMRMPSYREVCELFKVKSKDTAHKAIAKLAALGYVGVDATGKIIPKEHYFDKRSKHRTPYQMHHDLRVLGLVDAGFGSPAEEQDLDTVKLDEWLIEGDREKYFMLEVSGESMKDAGINPGDMVIVERTDSARAGDIVIASIDGGWTIKYLRYTKDKKAYLEPANPDFKDLHPEENLEIAAVVRSLVRKYDK